MRIRFRLFLIPLYQDKPGFLAVIIILFAPGSIVADIDLIFNSTEATPTVQEIRDPIAEAIANGSAPFSIESFAVDKKSASKGDDGLETWKIVLIVCLGVVLLILVLVSILIIYKKSRGKRAGRRNSFHLDYGQYSYDVDQPYAKPSNKIANNAQSFEIEEKGNTFL